MIFHPPEYCPRAPACLIGSQSTAIINCVETVGKVGGGQVSAHSSLYVRMSTCVGGRLSDQLDTAEMKA